MAIQAAGLRTPDVLPRADRPARRRQRAGTRILVAALVVVVAMRFEIAAGVTLGMAAALAVAPVWAGRLQEFSGGLSVPVLGFACLLNGLWLTSYAAADHTVIDRQVVSWSLLLIGLVTTVGVVLWARTLFGDGTVAVLYGIGMLASTSPGALMSSPNPWKFQLSMPITVLVLGAAWQSGRRWLQVGLALALAGVSAVNDSRSHVAILLLAATVVVWQAWFRGTARRRGSTFRAIVLLAALTWAIYALGQALLLEGHLGQETQLRSQEQVQRSGSVLLGARPEIGATIALMGHRPLGLGMGTSPTVEEILVAKSGMAGLGYDPNNGYVENYMFGELVELHSIVGDTWALFGIAGLALSAFIAWAAFRRTAAGLGSGTLSALAATLAIRMIWDLFFGPFYSTLPFLALALALALERSSATRTGPSGEHGFHRRVDPSLPGTR